MSKTFLGTQCWVSATSTNLDGTACYELASFNHNTTRCPFNSHAALIICVMVLVCSKQPSTLEFLPSALLIQYSHSGGEILSYYETDTDRDPIPSAGLHSFATLPLCRSTPKSTKSNYRRPGQHCNRLVQGLNYC